MENHESEPTLPGINAGENSSLSNKEESSLPPRISEHVENQKGTTTNATISNQGEPALKSTPTSGMISAKETTSDRDYAMSHAPPIDAPGGISNEAATGGAEDNRPQTSSPPPPAPLQLGNSLLKKPTATDQQQLLAKQREYALRFRAEFAADARGNATAGVFNNSVTSASRNLSTDVSNNPSSGVSGNSSHDVPNDLSYGVPGLPAGSVSGDPSSGANNRAEPELDEGTGQTQGSPDHEAAEFMVIKMTFEQKKRQGTLSMEEEIEFMKLESKERARQHKARNDMAYELQHELDEDSVDNDNELFVPEVSNPDFRGREDDGPAPKKRRRARKDSDAERDGSRAQQARPRKRGATTAGGKKGRNRNSPSHAYSEDELVSVLKQAQYHANGEGKDLPNAAYTQRKPHTRKRKGPELTNLGSIMGSNVFADTEEVAGRRDPPTFDSTTRAGALKELIASFPEEGRKNGFTDAQALNEAIKDFDGIGTVRPAPDGNWGVKGLRTTLKHYQVLGVAFMRRRENGYSQPRGGILADGMGMGKTLTMLANIVNGQRATPCSKISSTLIVVPPALVSQWRTEIDTHCQNKKENKIHGIGTIIYYHTGSRMMSNNLQEMLETSAIVLTTYQEVRKSFPKAIVPSELITAAQKEAWWKTYYQKAKGILHQARFHRVVIDEAHAIKNHKGHTSMAVRALQARHYWAVTGTPVLNCIEEFYPYFTFIREPYTGSFKIFKENFCRRDDSEDGFKKLMVFLQKFMIRRTHADTFLDARLLNLPQPTENTAWLEFNEVERSIYEIVKNRMIQRINSANKTEGLTFTHVWTMILRLRQMCGHILAIQSTITDVLEREDFEKLNKITQDDGAMSDACTETLIRLRQVLANNLLVKEVNTGRGDVIITESEAVPPGMGEADGIEEATLGGRHGQSYPLGKYLNKWENSEQFQALNERAICCACRQKPDQPVITSCFHLFCLHCIESSQHQAARQDRNTATCPFCGTNYHSTEPVQNFRGLQGETSTETASSDGGSEPKRGRKKKKNETELEDWISLNGEVLPSAKTVAAKSQIQNWLLETPNCKIIIYTLFIPIVRILAKMCQTEQWQYVKYTGEMSQDARTKAIEDFGKKNEVRIMLATMTCGGQGLNLTMASRVICFDPWWNESVEQQAFCRVFRIGQTEETRMTRFVIRNTIDEVMMITKKRKQLEIDEVMSSYKQHEKRLDIRDLMRLFGPVGSDEQGKPFIFAEENDEDGEDHVRFRDVNFDDEDEMGFMGNEA